VNNRRFFGLLCAHKWEIATQSNILRSRSQECAGLLVVLRCEHCGDLKQKRIQV
jgi:hypothetical protein